jgi:competence protein ComEA
MRDALNAAGGASGEADLNQVNLAQVLHDGDHVYVPKIGEVPTPALVGVDSTEAALSGPLNINTATAEQLEALPGIGPAIAKRIVDYRDAHGPFANIEAIQNVSGIGPAIFGQIKDLITVN